MGAPELLKVDEVADRLKVSKSWVYDQISKGKIPVIDLPGRVRRIDWETLRALYIAPKSATKPRSLKTEKSYCEPVGHKLKRNRKRGSLWQD